MLRTAAAAAARALNPVGVPCEGVRVVLLDIEGTTTPIRFVTEVLFPYARHNVRRFLQAHGQEAAVRADVALLAREHASDLRAGAAPPPWSDDPAGIVGYVHFLMDQDSKSTALKALQGRIWQEGYAAGALVSEVYDDVPRAFARWRGQGRRLAIFSSGSVLAQKLLFSRTGHGDLTPAIDGWFDTTTGPKKVPPSYGRIAAALGVPASAVLFLSDVAAELQAAAGAGMRTVLCVRDGPLPASGDHVAVADFDAVCS